MPPSLIMASSTYCHSEIFIWIQNLPPVTQWKTSSLSTCICSSTSSQPSLNLSVTRKGLQSSTVFFNIMADFSIPVSLWSSKPLQIKSNSSNLLDDDTVSTLLINFVEAVLKYGSYKNGGSLLIKFVKLDSLNPNFKDMFDLAFLTLVLLICIYEAPVDLRSGCLSTLKNSLANCRSRKASTLLMKCLGPNLEEQWMRSINLAITNWIMELQANHRSLKTPSPLFSYGISTFGLWKVHLYCPVVAMDVINSSNPSPDERLAFSLNYHQLEGVIQINYKIIKQERWINLIVNTDNIRYLTLTNICVKICSVY